MDVSIPLKNLTVLHPTTIKFYLGDYANIKINTDTETKHRTQKKTNKYVTGRTKTKCWQNWLAGCNLWAPTYGY